MCVNAPVLAYYDKRKPIVLTVDSSSKGLGAAIMQEGKPIAYASCALTETQQRYSQTERETLAIVFGCSKFNNFIFGQHVTVENLRVTISFIKFRNYFSFQKWKDLMYPMSYKLVHAVVLSNDSLYVFVLVYIS